MDLLDLTTAKVLISGSWGLEKIKIVDIGSL